MKLKLNHQIFEHNIVSIRDFRLKLGLTQKELGYRADMTSQAVMRYEQHLYESLSDSLAEALATAGDCPVGEVHRLYNERREEIQIEANLNSTPPLVLEVGTHPFETFRVGLMRDRGLKESRIAFCILLALHPSVVADYDSGRMKKMPALIRRGLLTGGMPLDKIDLLDTFGEIAYERRSGS